MRRSTVIWLTLACVLIAVGAVIFGCVMVSYEWDFSLLSTVEYETNEYILSGEYKDISIVTNEADIVFKTADGEETKVVCYEQKDLRHSASLEDGVLTVNVKDTRKWYEHIGINFSSPKITVYIPAGEYGELSIETDTGDVSVPKELSFADIIASSDTGEVTSYASASGEVSIRTSTGDVNVEGVSSAALTVITSTGDVRFADISCDGDIKLNVDTGEAKLTDVNCQSFISDGDTGDLYLIGFIAKDKISVTRDTGDVRFDSSDADVICVETDTGDVRGTLLSEKVFVAATDTGIVDVPETEHGGKCEITSSTGDIIIRIED